MSPAKNPKKPTKRTTGKASEVFSDEEKAAMQELVRERKAAARGKSKADGEADVLAKIAEMSEPDRAMAGRIHDIVKASAPEISARTWYGMPAYAKDDKVVCFFQSGQKFKTRYATFGFSDKAHLDEGDMWATGFAVTKLTKKVEARIAALVKQAVSEA
jgi:uncharacterized protein YdhG (YjbR/CyaY superfamily)